MKRLLLVILLLVVVVTGYTLSQSKNSTAKQSKVKLYWFIPDGMRAEPDLFNIYAWAREGKLPNIKKLMDRGTYGYSYPNFPSHTPTNFATLLTGSMPEIHGVDDGPMREVGKPLDEQLPERAWHHIGRMGENGIPKNSRFEQLYPQCRCLPDDWPVHPPQKPRTPRPSSHDG